MTNPQLTSYSMGKFESFSSKIGTRQVCPSLFNIVLEILARAIREEKEDIEIRKDEIISFLFGDDILLHGKP